MAVGYLHPRSWSGGVFVYSRTWGEPVAPPTVQNGDEPSGGWFMRPYKRRKHEEEAAPQDLEAARTEPDISPGVNPAEAAPTHIVTKAGEFAYKPEALGAIRKDAIDAYLDERERIEALKKKKRRDEEFLLLM